MPMDNTLIVRRLGLSNYHDTYEAMKIFTDSRSVHTSDEIWLVQHDPVFTLGRRGELKHILDAGHIPVVHVDRGGQVTYHGPGQLVVYLLLDLQRRILGIRTLVDVLQKSIMQLLLNYGIESSTQLEAPGVYVNDRKIASIGLRVRRGCCYHGISLNVAMDLTPFSRINPCGYAGLGVTQICDLQGPGEIDRVEQDLTGILQGYLAHDNITIHETLYNDRHISQRGSFVSTRTLVAE